MRLFHTSVVVAAVLTLATWHGVPLSEMPQSAQTETQGVLWHNNYALDIEDGTQLASPSGKPPRTVDANKVARTVPDGSRFAYYDYDSRNERTTLTVKRTADGAVLHRRMFDGYLRDVKPSGQDAGHVVVRYSDDVGDPTSFRALDLRTGTELERYPAATMAVAWLADGRVVAVGSDGVLSAGVPRGARSTTGRVDLLGRQVRHIAVEPRSSQLLLGLVAVTGRNNVTGADLWITNLDGTNIRRFTNTNMTSYGVWSPDGQRIAFDIDTGTLCYGSQCTGACEIWHAPASATLINPVPAAPGVAARFSVVNRHGDRRTLGCELLGWTP
jgi:hypothetical protein